MCRRRYYLAPEIARGEPYDEKCDVYSLGVLFLEMCFQGGLREAFSHRGGMQLMGMVAVGWRPEIPRGAGPDAAWGCFPGLEALIGACMADRPADRPSSSDVWQSLSQLMGEDPTAGPPPGLASKISSRKRSKIKSGGVATNLLHVRMAEAEREMEKAHSKMSEMELDHSNAIAQYKMRLVELERELRESTGHGEDRTRSFNPKDSGAFSMVLTMDNARAMATTCPSTLSQNNHLFFQIERAALHSYDPGPHSC